MITFFKRNYLWILLIGSLVGMNETITGSMNFPYRSVVLSAITLSILFFSRFYFPKPGTSLLIMMIAVIFKANTIGFNNCSSTFFLCGPTALLLLGIGFEVFSSIFIKHKIFNLYNITLSCLMTSMLAFSLFAIMNTYILNSWDTSRLLQYIFIKGTLTAIVSSVICITGLYLIKTFNNVKLTKLNPYILNSILGFITLALWLFGSFSS
ncbi:MAG: hypothetical protein ACOYO1_01335 [Bacteroidales bacterium]